MIPSGVHTNAQDLKQKYKKGSNKQTDVCVNRVTLSLLERLIAAKNENDSFVTEIPHM